MASGNEMLETCSGSGSSDSFINISRSGASSIKTFATSTNSTLSTTSKETLFAQVQKLQEEKKDLEGRIRGIKTLSDLLVECRKEKEVLKLQVQNLTQRLKQLESMSDSHLSSATSPFSLVSSQALQQQKTKDISKPNSIDNMALLNQEQTPKKSTSPGAGDVFLPVSYPPFMGPPSSLQETKGPPDDHDRKHLISLTDSTRSAWSPLVLEVAPKQESLTPEPARNGSGEEKVKLLGSSASGHSSPELLQPDSDKYDEATYEKVGLQLERGLSGDVRSYSHYGASRSTPREEPRDFPSLSSGLSTGMTHSHASGHSSTLNPSYMTMIHQGHVGADRSNSGLAAEVESLTERLHSEPADGSPAIAEQMQQIAERISKVERKDRDQKKLISTLMQENQQLKMQVKMADSSHLEETLSLREQNTRLMQQLKSRRDDETTVIKATGAKGDWVHVERPKLSGSNQSAESDHFLVDRVRKLELEKAELLRANSSWKSQWDKMEQSHRMATDELRSKVALTEQEIPALKSRLDEQTSQFELRMLEMKRRIEDEESQKEDAVHQLRLVERQCTELQNELSEVRTQLSDTARDKQALSAELSVLKAKTGQEMQQSSEGGSAGTSRAALEAEIAMLKVQLKVFAEDFEHEREDRTIAQSARDTAKKNAETMARQNHSLSSQVQHLQKQIKDRDDTISWTLQQNETMKRQLSDLKKKLESEWEEKQRVQRLLTTAQQQQQHQHQTLRNPYRTPDPQAMYSSTAPYQPPQQLPPGGGGTSNTTPFYGNQSRPVPCPEHLPGAWTCSFCTYINYPGRTVCDSCGMVNSPRSHYPDNFGYPSQDTIYGSSEHALLMSRGGDQSQNGRLPAIDDLVIDTQARGNGH